jgi:hypothetical protein
MITADIKNPIPAICLSDFHMLMPILVEFKLPFYANFLFLNFVFVFGKKNACDYTLNPSVLLNHWSLEQLGAAAVNLVAGEKPTDVYSGIAAR